jgi:Ca2+/H+ antiporter
LHEGFLGTAAPFYADLVLLLETVMGLALLVGAFLAHLRKFQAHAWCQSTVVLLNAVVIALAMLPSFHIRVSPRIPLRLGKAFYALATAHAALGTVVECAGIYILLAAGTTLMPEKFRLIRYKLWMRVVLAGWWAVILLGVATYGRWYIPGVFRR